MGLIYVKAHRSISMNKAVCLQCTLSTPVSRPVFPVLMGGTQVTNRLSPGCSPSSSPSLLGGDGDFLELVKLGFPLPAAVCLQQAGFNLRSACWDVRKSLTGFSLSFFWPASQTPGSRAVSETHKAHCPIDAMKKRRRRRQSRARAQAQVAQPSAHDSNSHTSKSDNSSDDIELRSRDAVESRTVFCT